MVKDTPLTPAIGLLEIARESGVSPSQLKKYIQLAGQKGPWGAGQFTSYLQSPIPACVLEAAKCGTLKNADPVVLRRALGLPPKAETAVIDCDADPFVPNGWRVEEHQKGGRFIWALGAVILYLSSDQKDRNIVGTKLRTELRGKRVLNANVLDYLLAHPHLIPKKWKGKRVFFWGTIYRDSHGYLFVRCLYWSGDGWDWNSCWLGLDWDGGDSAAVRAS